MEFSAECAPCLLRRVLFQTRLVDSALEAQVMSACVRLVAEGWSPGINSARLATRVHRLSYDMMGVADPYRDLKAEANRVALSLLPRAQEMVDLSEDRLKTACLVAIAGNVMDFGIGGFESPEELRSTFDSLTIEEPEPNDLPRMRELLREAKEVVYLFDNCGEIVLDLPLLRELKKLGLKVTGVVKGEPIITDATWEDLSISGADQILDQCLTTGVFAIGVDLKAMPDELKRAFDSADLIIAKGMANFEALSDSDMRPIVHLLRSKCHPVSLAIGARKDRNVIKLFE
ncbi:MAG TPA: ARMT1-like domain-containing protein [Methanomassiliicoccales archaeon]|nr:ARMT1-like domain-containing protein [Methanomassiliicoccales archaeon]